MKGAIKKILYDKGHRLELLIILAVILALAITLAIQFFSQTSIHHLVASDERVMLNYESDNALESLDRNLIAMESNVRSYIISGAAGLIADIGANIAEARESMDRIRRGGVAGTVRAEKIRELEELTEAKIHFSESVLDSFSTGGEEAAIILLNTREGLRLRDSIMEITSWMRQIEKQSITQTIQANRMEADRVRMIDYISTLLAIAIVFLAILSFLKAIEKRAAIQKKLEEAKVQAEQSALLKEQFMANMSHEIRTPLNAIIAYSQILRKSALESRQMECAEGIHQSGENLLSIVNDILDFSKIEAGMVRLEQVAFSIRSLLFSVENLFQARARAKKLSLVQHPLPQGPDLLVGDPTRLTQILANLIGNAVKFTEEGGVQIWGSLKPSGENSILLELKIQDTGIGIPEALIGSIFERFSQGATDITRRFGGTGLGLAITRNLVEAMGGSISVQSKPGVGSTFTVRLPFGLADVKETGQVGKVTDSTPASLAIPLDCRILIVEDNPMNQRIAELLLEEWGLAYGHAANGRQALECLKEQSYSLILMDIQMPEMDGYSAADAIRNQHKLDIPIIAMTAHVMAGERERCLNHGMNDYLSKPIQEGALLALLNKYLAPPPTQAGFQEPGSQESLIDFDYLKSISRGKKDRLQEMASIFLQQAPREWAAIQQAFQHQDMEGLARQAHSMRSTVAYMGLEKSLGALLKNLEQDARQGAAPDSLARQLSQVGQALEEALRLVRRQIIEA